MWPFKKEQSAVVRLTDTLSGAKREFVKKSGGPVTMYSCGPTVYGPQHIGNLRAAVFADTLARTLKAAGYKVQRVVNITDVGHLVGDGDEGEDKMAVGAAREHTTPEAIAKRYTAQYLADIAALNIDTTTIEFPRATAYIPQQKKMIEVLMRKGLAYETSDGVYFDTAKFPDYGELGNVKQILLKAGARVAMGEKRNEHDFVLWRMKKPGELQSWDSPWGEGNPGWSIECSAMATSLLGNTIDIHTGGQDHIHVHHNNEIAQSEGATGVKPFARYWLHNAFLTIGGEKVSKSLGNTYTLDDVKAKSIHPLALRYLFMQAHYRTPLSFTWDSLEAADTALKRLWKLAREVSAQSGKRGEHPSRPGGAAIRAYALDDLKTPSSLETLWSELTFPENSPEKKWDALISAEEVLGLSLTNPPEEAKTLSAADLPADLQPLAKEREEARKNKDFARSDELRIHFQNRGYAVDDGPSGSTYTKNEK